MQMVMLSPSQLVESQSNPRKRFEAIEELAESIKVQGMVQPIVVRQSGQTYQIIAGARRFRAAVMARLTAIPCVVRSAHDVGVMETQITENVHRKNLDHIERAEAFQQLMVAGSFTVEQLSGRLGIPPQTIYRSIKLLELTDNLKRELQSKSLDVTLATSIARMPREEQEACYQEAKKKNLSWKGTENFIIAERKRIGNPYNASRTPRETDRPKCVIELYKFLNRREFTEDEIKIIESALDAIKALATKEREKYDEVA